MIHRCFQKWLIAQDIIGAPRRQYGDWLAQAFGNAALEGWARVGWKAKRIYQKGLDWTRREGPDVQWKWAGLRRDIPRAVPRKRSGKGSLQPDPRGPQPLGWETQAQSSR